VALWQNIYFAVERKMRDIFFWVKAMRKQAVKMGIFFKIEI